MSKKAILLIFFIALINFMFNSCCTKITEQYIEINGFNVSLLENMDSPNNSLNNGDTTFVDTLIIQAGIEYDFIANNQYLVNSLYATTCPEWGEYGLKNKIQEIIFTSNEEFQEREPNSNLNEFMTCNYYFIRKDISLDSLKDVLNNWHGGNFLDNCTFFINYKPDNNKQQEFKIIFKLDNNEAIEMETQAIVWI